MKSASSKGLAVVTGAAGGLGSAFARQLAERGYQLLLVDRRQEPLEKLCVEIAEKYGIHAEALAVDFCQRSEVERLARQLAASPNLELLVNNAGFGTVDYFADTDVNWLVGQVDVHIVAPTILTRAVLPGMMERRRGSIINLSSIGGWFASAGNVQYGSTKNWLAVFSQSLAQEVRGTNVHVQALCPGFVRTGFHAADGMRAYRAGKPHANHLWMTPDEVVAYSLKKLGSKQVVVIPGFGYRVLGFLARMPLLVPLFSWITWTPRYIHQETPAVSQPDLQQQPAETYSEPRFSVAKRA
jgi:short-subunit dehydrogenase